MRPMLDRAIETIARVRAPKEPPPPTGAAIERDLIGVVEQPKCPLCGGTRAKTLLVACDSWLEEESSRQRFAVVRCEICSARYTSPRFKHENARLSFPKSYPFYVRANAKRGLEEKDLEAARRAFYGRAARLSEAAPRPGRLLDLGCGDGFFLDVMRARGWHVSGIDIEDSVARFARDRLALRDVVVGDMESDPLPEGPFDAVTLWGSLQLVYRPQALLAKIRRVLRPGGILAIGVSNAKGAGAHLFRAHWRGLGLPRHLVHYTPETLRRLMQWSDYDIVRLWFETPRWIIAGSIDDMMPNVGPLRRLAKGALYAASPVIGRTRFGDTIEAYAHVR